VNYYEFSIFGIKGGVLKDGKMRSLLIDEDEFVGCRLHAYGQTIVLYKSGIE